MDSQDSLSRSKSLEFRVLKREEEKTSGNKFKIKIKIFKIFRRMIFYKIIKEC